jgi:hypothetical protein
MRAGVIGVPTPYKIFGEFAGLPFWGGGLTLLAAAPGVGKTSWMLRMLFDAAVKNVPTAIGCYEHTEEELKYRISQQVTAMLAGPHGEVEPFAKEDKLAECGNAVLLSLDDRRDTVRGLEDVLLNTYNFPQKGNALLTVDYLNRMPVVGLTGMIPLELRSGEAAAALRAMSRRHEWAIIVAAALKAESFYLDEDFNLGHLLGDERVPYEADRVLLVSRDGDPAKCGCLNLVVHTLKDRTGPTRTWKLQFWGERFYPALESEFDGHIH